MLALKQNNYESISDKNNQISELKEALHEIGGLVHDLKQTVLCDLQDMSDTLSWIESVKLNFVTQMKNEPKILKQDMKHCECSEDTINNTRRMFFRKAIKAWLGLKKEVVSQFSSLSSG